MLPQLIMARAALSLDAPDIDTHAAMNCALGRMRTSVAETVNQLVDDMRALIKT